MNNCDEMEDELDRAKDKGLAHGAFQEEKRIVSGNDNNYKREWERTFSFLRNISLQCSYLHASYSVRRAAMTNAERTLHLIKYTGVTNEVPMRNDSASRK